MGDGPGIPRETKEVKPQQESLLGKIFGTGPRKEKPNYSEELKKRLIGVKEDVGSWTVDESSASYPRQSKFHLPDTPIIPQTPHNNERVKGELIGVGVLRGEDVYSKRDPNDRYEGDTLQKERYQYGNDSIVIPNNFFTEGSFVVVLVPIYSSIHSSEQTSDLELSGYSITVLQLQGKDLIKLTMDDKWLSKTHKLHEDKIDPYKMVPKEGGPHHAVDAIESASQEPQLLSMRIDPSDKNGSVEVKYENLTRDLSVQIPRDEKGRMMDPTLDSAEAQYKRTVNGTVCYRLVEGKVERQKSKEPNPSLVSVPAKFGI